MYYILKSENSMNILPKAVDLVLRLHPNDRMPIEFEAGNCSADLECIGYLVDRGFSVRVYPHDDPSKYTIHAFIVLNEVPTFTWHTRSIKK